MTFTFTTRRTAAAGCLVLLTLAWLTWRFWPSPGAPDMGVSSALARERAERVSDLRYALTLRIPAERTAPIAGRMSLTFQLRGARRPLALDFRQPTDRVRRVTVGDETLTPQVENGHLLLPASVLVEGANTVEIEFIAGDDPLNRDEDYLYSLFVPARASLAIPCFDQPDLKGRWSLSLDVPREWVAVSNARESGRAATADRLHLLFEETKPLPPYLVAFAAGRFSIETADRGGRPMRLFHRETDAQKIARHREALFDLHAAALEWMQNYTTLAYPFDKFDFLLLPSFQFSGMEHPGAIYYNANSLLLEPSATQQQLLNRASLIAHETSHMWFGNLVTMRWFNDVWMKEVFANLMASKIVNPSFPGVNHEVRFLYQHLPAAYDVDRTAGANPIRQSLDNLDEAGSLYGPIIYQKAPVVLQHLELAMGADAFRSGVSEYLRAHQYGNADWPDLVRQLDPRTPLDLDAWSSAWIEQAGRPTVRTELKTERGIIGELAFVQDDPRGRGLRWPQRLLVTLDAAGEQHSLDVTLAGDRVTVPAAVGMRAPTWVVPFGRGFEYGFFDVDAATLAFLSTRLASIRDPLVRAAGLVALWEAMLEARVEPPVIFRLLVNAVPSESDELTLQHMLDLLRTLFWRFTGPDERPAAAAQLEPVLRRGLDRARAATLKGAWFATLRGTALTSEGVAWLEQVWQRRVVIPGLPLTEVDEIDLAFELALRDIPTAPDLLKAQRARIANPDRLARFDFLQDAVSSQAPTRDRFFASLSDRRNRRREAWVVDAARYLHHPLRAAHSRRYIRPALDLLPELQRTGDIFLPKRWADATLAGYQSVQTAADVQEYLEALPRDYPDRLRWILLSAADPLFRTARFQQ